MHRNCSPSCKLNKLSTQNLPNIQLHLSAVAGPAVYRILRRAGSSHHGHEGSRSEVCKARLLVLSGDPALCEWQELL